MSNTAIIGINPQSKCIYDLKNRHLFSQHLDFQDSQSFEDICIDGDNLSTLDENDGCLLAMEKYSRTALIGFVPFRDVKKDLQIDGKYLPKFRKTLKDWKLTKNTQITTEKFPSCCTSFNSARPNDPLECITYKPRQCLYETICDQNI